MLLDFAFPAIAWGSGVGMFKDENQKLAKNIQKISIVDVQNG
jgi:hypothetical protein